MIDIPPDHTTRLAIRSSLSFVGMSGISGGFTELDFGMWSNVDDKDLYDYAMSCILFYNRPPMNGSLQSIAWLHHGGAGSTAAALRSVVRKIMIPCIAEQYGNSSLVNDASWGFGLKRSLRKISAQDLAMSRGNVSSVIWTKIPFGPIANELRQRWQTKTKSIRGLEWLKSPSFQDWTTVSGEKNLKPTSISKSRNRGALVWVIPYYAHWY